MSVKTGQGDVELGQKGENALPRRGATPRAVHYDDKTSKKFTTLNISQNKDVDDNVKLGTIMGVFVPTLQNILGA